MNRIVIRCSLAATMLGSVPSMPHGITQVIGKASNHGSMAKGSACSDTTSLLLARAVILAAPILLTDDNVYLNDGEPLKAFAQAFRPYFLKDGKATRCAAVVGPLLVRHGLKLYDREAYGRIISTAPPEIAGQSREIADRINQPSTDMVEMGQELTWLSQVLPAVADGDMRPFNETGYPLRNYKRQQITAVWPGIQAVCSAGDCREILAMALPLVRQMADSITFGMIYSMVRLANLKNL